MAVSSGDEPARVAAAARYLAVPAPADLRGLVRLMGEACQVPMAAMTVIGGDTVQCEAGWHVPEASIPRSAAFCPVVLEADAPVIVEDTTVDPRFAANPMVTGGPRVRFYAGAPLHSEGHVVGSLCVYDVEPRAADGRLRRTLETLASWVDAEAASRHTLMSAAPAIDRTESFRKEIIATVSHEVRTPAASIQGYLEVLADQLGTGAQHARYVRAIERNIARLCRTVDELLITAYSTSGGLAPQHEIIDLSQLTARAISQLGSGGRFRLSAPAAPVVVDGDSDLLSRAIGNVLGNAVLHSDPEVVIAVAVRGGPAATVSVTDGGPGIPPDELGYVRQAFFRGARARDGHLPGIGLGLTVAGQIAEAHGGQLVVASGPAGGTTVTLTLPSSRR